MCCAGPFHHRNWAALATIGHFVYLIFINSRFIQHLNASRRFSIAIPFQTVYFYLLCRHVRSKNLEANQNIFANLASKATLSSSMRRSSMSAVPSTNGLTETVLAGRTAKGGTATARPPNKFKTSGIVATAVAKPLKKQHKSDAPFPVLKLDGAAAAVSETSLKSPTTVKEFVKKVKTKFKKRKNKSEKV